MAFGDHDVPTIIRLREKWAEKRVLGPPPEFERESTWEGVYDGSHWAWWRRGLFRLTSDSAWLPQRL